MLFQTDMQLVVCCGVGRIAVAVHYIADCTGGALAHAQAAVGALLRIDGGNIVVDAPEGQLFSHLRQAIQPTLQA